MLFTFLSSDFSAQICNDPLACNFSLDATDEDGPCDFCSCVSGLSFTSSHPQYGIEIQTVAVHTDGDLTGLTTYRLYFSTEFSTDEITSFIGNDVNPLSIASSTTFYQEPIFGSITPANISGAVLSFIPDIAFDSWVTIGIDGPAEAGESNASLLPGTWGNDFEDGGNITINDGLGSGWYILPGALNGEVGSLNKILFAQLTTDGDLSGTFRVQVFPQGDSTADDRVDIAFSFSVGDSENVCGCMSTLACNYNPLANYDDGGCQFSEAYYDCDGNCLSDIDTDGICDEFDDCTGEYDACGVCNGSGEVYECGCTEIPEGDCDCEGNTIDIIGICGGGCLADLDSDGICDSIDDCVGDFDICGVCNGPGEVYECGCAEIPTEDCDCNGLQLDALGDCGGNCEDDLDDDGVCDDIDTCIGFYDECGICNGPGEIYECGCYELPVSDCDCGGLQLDDLGICGGDCIQDSDEDGICDDIDDCVGAFDECGICNGTGEIYECGCSDIPEGECDCNGNVLDAIGICGGECSQDSDEDGICDDIDECVGAYDECGICNGPGEIYECGCADITEGDCECPEALSFTSTHIQYGLEITKVLTHTEGDLTGLTTYRMYFTTANADDIITSITGNDEFILSLNTTTSFYQEPVFGGVTPENISSEAIDLLPDLAYDSWITIGIDGPAEIGEATASLLPGNWPTTFENGNSFTVNDGLGSGWYILPESVNGIVGASNQILIAQLTTNGDLSGSFRAQIFPNGNNDSDERIDITFSYDNNSSINICGCTSTNACNYNPQAINDDGSCEFAGEYYDCFGNCTIDIDSDGICDDTDDCIGAYDNCGICNGPGEIYECGCLDIPEGDCDCNANVLDALGICGGECLEDIDIDGICDNSDECIGAYDECGICNGPGEVYECGCSDFPEEDCDCEGNHLDVIGVCGGDCSEDSNENGVCDIDEYGCTDSTNPNFNPYAAFEDGSCFIGGCVSEFACNYNPEAEYQIFGACEFTTCVGCTDSVACNYDSTATINSNYCTYSIPHYNCDGECINDLDLDGVCDEIEIEGCTDSSNPGYSPYATNDNGSCLTAGCTLPFACNYTPTAGYLDITSCDFSSCVGCVDPNACNYDSSASLPSTCVYPLLPFRNCEGDCYNDTDGDGVCDEQEIEGCTDMQAGNFNPNATEDNGSCIIQIGGCVLPFACNYDPEADYYLPGSCDFSCLF